MIAKDNLPMNSTEKEGFKYVFHTAVPLYKIPGRKAISKLIYEKYDVLSEQVKDKLKKIESVTVTTDVWTETMSTTSFLGFTVHFLFKEKLESINIGVVELDESHTGEYLSNQLQSTLKEWGITDK